jgi:hypothetical protein
VGAHYKRRKILSTPFVIKGHIQSNGLAQSVRQAILKIQFLYKVYPGLTETVMVISGSRAAISFSDHGYRGVEIADAEHAVVASPKGALGARRAGAIVFGYLHNVAGVS